MLTAGVEPARRSVSATSKSVATKPVATAASKSAAGGLRPAANPNAKDSSTGVARPPPPGASRPPPVSGPAKKVEQKAPGSGGKAEAKPANPEEEKLRANILSEVMVTGQSVSWDSIAGLVTAKKALQEAVIYPALRPELYTVSKQPIAALCLESIFSCFLSRYPLLTTIMVITQTVLCERSSRCNSLHMVHPCMCDGLQIMSLRPYK